MFTASSHSNNKVAFRFKLRVLPKVFNFRAILFTEIVKAQAILLFVHDFAKRMLQNFALRSVHNTFEDRVLNASAVIYALLCNLTKAFSTGGILRVDIICYQNQQNITLLSHKRRICIQITAQISGKEHGLSVRDKSPCDFFFEKRVRYFLLFSFLPC